MAGVRTLASGRKKWMVLTAKPANPSAMTASDLSAAINVGDKATRDGSFIRATPSNTIDSTHFNSEAQSQVFGESNYNAQIEPYQYRDASTGKLDGTDNALHAAFATKGTTLYIWERKGPKEPVAAASGDDYTLYEVLTDAPQEPDATGYMRDVVPLAVQQVWTGTLGS